MNEVYLSFIIKGKVGPFFFEGYYQHGNYIFSFWVKKFNVNGCLCAGKNQVDHETLWRNCEGNVNYRSSITYV